MNYAEFKNKTEKWPIIFSQDLMPHRGDKQIIRNQLERWRVRKLLIKLRRGAFLLNTTDRKGDPSRTYIANQLYGPSYVSLEYALQFYGLIPERVNDLTSVTTRKTMRFTNEIGTFIYQHIKPKVFRAFKMLKDETGLVFFIAEPEKALIDFFYLNLNKLQTEDEKIFEESYRLQNLEVLKMKKVMEFAEFFDCDKLVRVSRSFCRFLKEVNR